MFWQTFLITFLAFSGALLALSLGWILAGKRLRGSCGGLGADGEDACTLCTTPADECPRRKRNPSNANASRKQS